jgi:Xaa-Pro aminopeptidase
MPSSAFCNRPALLDAMRRRQFDALVAVSSANVTYTSGLELYTQTLIPERLVICVTAADGSATLIAWGGERDKIERDAWVRDVRYYAEFGESPIALLATVLSERGLATGNIGIEIYTLAAVFYQELVGLLPHAHFHGCEDVFAAARMLKTPAEITLLRDTSRAVDKALWLAAQLVRPGETEQMLARQITTNVLTLIDSEMAEIGGVDGSAASGPNVAVMHHHASNRRMERGELVRYGCKANFSGYWSIIVRMAAIGHASDQDRDSYARFAEAYHRIIDQLKPGLPVAEAFHACRRELERRELQIISEKIGHSTGLIFRETPILTASDAGVLQADMVLAYDFLVRDKHGTPFHIEDRVVITPTGAEIISDISPTTMLTVLE